MSAMNRSPNQHPPNILVLWTDEQRADSLGCAGNPLARTPHLDRLARRAVRFEHCAVSQPVCTPSRATVLTGLWPHQSGCVANNVRLRADTPTIAERLGDGWDCTYFGKWHLGDEVTPQHGFTDWASIEDGYKGWFSADRDRSELSSYSYWLIAQGFRPDRGPEGFTRHFASCLSEPYAKTTYLAERAVNFLRQRRDRPFLLHVNFLEPHTPVSGPYNDRHRPDRQPLPGNLGPDDYPVPARYAAKRERHQSVWSDPERLQSIQARYAGLVEQVDTACGRILAELEAQNLDRDTVVVFTSDHGNCLGSHGMMEKTVLYDEAVRVPLLLALPDGRHAGRCVREPVSHIDLVPTLLDAAGCLPADDLPGMSLLPRLDGAPPVDDHVHVQWHPVPTELAMNAGNGAFTDHVAERCIIAPDGWKYVWRGGDEPELLVHLGEDPGEQHDRSRDPQVATIRARLRERIRTWQTSTGDTLTVGE